MDLPETAPNLHEYTVGELSQAVKRAVEDRFGYVRVRGELSGVKRAASGHLYLALKDENAVLDGVCWRGTAGRLAFKPEDGLEVIVTGKLTTYPGRSKYQIVIEHMEPAGVGALMALLEERRKALAAEGLFAAERKQELPFLPEVIGVVTSPTGAVIRDILHRLADRFPRHVLVWPVLVQGEGAAEQVAAAIDGFNRLDADGAVPRPDVLIVARGGGSIEDLWAFNEEAVVRAAAASAIPLISAVGHETDTTLIDHAADRRAPTPTAAAEMAVPVQAELLYTVADLHRRLEQVRGRHLDRLAERLQALARALPRPRDLLGLAQQRLDELAERLPRGLIAVARGNEVALNRLAGGLTRGRLDQTVRLKQNQLAAVARRLEVAGRRPLDEARMAVANAGRLLDTLGYQQVLARGYAVVYGADGKPVTSVAPLTPATEVAVELRDGRRAMTVTGEAPAGRRPAKPTAKRTKKRAAKTPTAGDGRQGSLL